MFEAELITILNFRPPHRIDSIGPATAMTKGIHYLLLRD
jgi:hypothetical protein